MKTRTSLELGKLYKLRCSALNVWYRPVENKDFGPFDCMQIEGPHRQDVCFAVVSKTLVRGATTHIKGVFSAARSGKFADFCRDHLAKFEFKDGALTLVFCDEMTGQPAYSVPLAVQA